MNALLFVVLVPFTALAATSEDTKAEKRVSALDSAAFCFKLGPAIRLPIGKDEAYRAAMLRRAERNEGLTGKMLGAINVREPVLGMNLCSVMAAFGKPTRASRTTTRHGEHWQLVYEHPKRYVYLDDGHVVAWQD